jgi:hypothetical protein
MGHPTILGREREKPTNKHPEKSWGTGWLILG